jgi:hypothetical protein
MKSKGFLRSSIELDHPKLDLDQVAKHIKPGDQVLFRIPFFPGDVTKSLWGYVVEKKRKGKSFFVAVDEIFIMNKRTQTKDGDVVEVKIEDVVGVIDGFDFDNKPCIHLTMQDGAMIDLRRGDGKTSPIIVVIHEGDSAHAYQADHSGSVDMGE